MATLNSRYNPPGLTEPQKDALNLKISREITASGYVGVFTTELNGRKVLRICAMHPETTQADIRSVICRLHETYGRLLRRRQPCASDQFAS